jgi:hypothetical protein
MWTSPPLAGTVPVIVPARLRAMAERIKDSETVVTENQ